MEQYNITAVKDGKGEPALIIEPAPGGRWTEFETVKYLEALVEDAIKEITGLKVAANKSNVDCNCLLNADALKSRWICPAHGYKKL